MYDFKFRNKLIAISKKIESEFMNDKKFKIFLKVTQLHMRQKIANAISFANVKIKLIHDKRHKLLFLKEGDKAYLKLHKNYKLSENHNKKLSNQRCDSFLMKRRVDRFAYELELFSKWRIHFVIFVIQLKSVNDENSYDKKRSNYPKSMKIEKDTEFERLYEVEKIVDKRQQRYDKIMMTQYFIRWLGYGPKYDEWKNLSALANCKKLVDEYEKRINTTNNDESAI